MGESSSDWDLGQRLIEKGACTLDQVREVLSLQDRLRKMGAVPKPFARVLLEKGFATRAQLAAAGVAERDLPPDLEAKPGPRPVASSRSKLPYVLGFLALAGAASLLLLPGPRPDAAPIDPAAAERLVDAELARLEALAAASSRFENAVEVVRGYERLGKAQSGKRGELEAHRRLKAYRERAEEFAKPELEEIRKLEPALRAERRFRELLQRYRGFPERFLTTTESGRAASETIAELSRLLRDAYLRERAEVEKLARERKYEEALALLKSAEIDAPEDRAGECAELRTRIERESRGAAERNRQEVADVYFKVDGLFKDAMARRDGAKAAQVVRDFLTAPWKPEQRPFVFARGVDYDALSKALEPWDPEKAASIAEAGVPEVDTPSKLGTAEAALLALRNAAWMSVFMRDYLAVFHAAVSTKETLELPSLGKGHFEKQEQRTVFVAADGAVLEPETSPLSETDFAALAMRVGTPDAAMYARVGFFYFYSAPKLAREAFENLARAAAGGARGVKLYLGGLAVAAEADLQRRLEVKLGAAEDLFKARQFAQAKVLLGDLLEHPEHPLTKAKRPDIERMLYEIAEGSAEQKKRAVKYLGKIDLLDAGRVRVTYDFESKEQMDAFEPVLEEGSRRFKGRWRIERGAMESSVDASVMLWKTPVQGDVTLDYDLTCVDEAQNVVLDLCYHRGKSAHYAVVLGFDWIGRQDGDRENSIEERFGMPRSCVLKYPVVVDKSQWATAAAWEGWTSRLVGKAGTAWRPEKGKTARLQVERQGRSIRVHADRALVWEGEDDEYREGGLLFYSDSRARVDNLSITFSEAP